MKPSLLRVLAGCLLCLALGACVAPRPAPKPQDRKARTGSSTASIYYFLAASTLRAQDYRAQANELYQKARDLDPRSDEIPRQILFNSFELFNQEGISAADLKDLIATHYRIISADENLLYSLIDFYDSIGDIDAEDRAVRNLEKNFPGARTLIQRFIFEAQKRGSVDTSYLDKALDLAWESPRDLLMVARIMAFFDAAKEKRALLRYHELASNEESSELLADVLVNTSDSGQINSYFASLSYPEDRARMQYLVLAALQSNKPELIMPLADTLLHTQDLDLLATLGFASLLTKRYDVLERISALMPDLPAPQQDKQPIYSLLAAYSLAAGFSHPLDSLLANLSEVRYFDELLTNYNYAVTGDAAAGWLPSGAPAYADFRAQLQSRLADAAPARYLAAVAKAVQDSTSTNYVDAQYELILYLRERGELSAEDYSRLLQYYYSHEMVEERLPLLREAVRKYPDNAGFNNDLGYLLLTSGGSADEAAKLIQRALASEPDNPYYLDSLAWVHYLAGEYEQALALVDKFAAMDNMPAEIAWHIGAIYLKNNDLENARKFLERSIGIGGDPASVDQAAQALKQLPASGRDPR